MEGEENKLTRRGVLIIRGKEISQFSSLAGALRWLDSRETGGERERVFVRRSGLMSQKRLNRVSLSHILRQLKMCGWYWGDLSSDEAEDVLRNTREGSFILRDSADACHLFTLSLKAHNLVVSVRVAFSRGQFKLDSFHQEDSPGFENMVDLVDYYLADRKRMFYVTVPEMGEFAVSLLHPVWKEVPTLQHLCRRCIVQRCRTAEELHSLPLPPHLVRYLQEYAPEDTQSQDTPRHHFSSSSSPSLPSHSPPSLYHSSNHRRPM